MSLLILNDGFRTIAKVFKKFKVDLIELRFEIICKLEQFFLKWQVFLWYPIVDGLPTEVKFCQEIL